MKKIFLFALAAITLASCSNDDKSGTEPKTLTKGKASMNVSFTLPQTDGTRATLNPNTDESAVKRISIYVFDSNGVAPTTGGYKDYTNITSDFDISGTTYTLKNNIETIAGTGMKVYAAINLPSGVGVFSSETALMAAVETVANMSTVAGGFTMFSEAETATLLEYDDTNATTIAATTTNVSLSVSRVVSKIVSSASISTYTNTWSNGVTLTYEIKAFGVYQEAIKSYLAKHATTLSPGNASAWSPYSLSVQNPNIPITDFPHPGNPAANAMTGVYVGENIPDASTNGKTTYIMVATQVKPNRAAKWNTTTETVDWATATYTPGTDDIYVVIAGDGTTYLTNDEDDAEEIALETSGVWYTFPECYVHFQVYVHRHGQNEYKVGRNDFIHVKVNGIKEIDGHFPGYPGDENDPEKPIDPTDPTDPNNPDPKDPDDLIDPETAMLNVEIEIEPWNYLDREIILE